MHCTLRLYCTCTAIFILVVSSAVLSTTCRKVQVTCQWASLSFLLAEFCCCLLKSRETVRLRQRSTDVQPMRKQVISLRYVSTRKQQNANATDKNFENSCTQRALPADPTFSTLVLLRNFIYFLSL